MYSLLNRIVAIGLTVLLISSLFAPVGSVTAATQTADTVEIRLEPTNATVDAGDTQTFDVIVDGADEISAFEFTLTQSEPGVSPFESFELAVDASFDETNVTDDTVAVDVGSGAEPIDASGGLTLGTVTISADESGQSELGFANGTEGVSIADELGEQYSVDSATGTTVTVEGELTDPAIDVSPASSEIDINDTASLTVGADVLPNGLSTYSVTLGYDPDVLSVSDDDVTTPAASTDDVTVSNGTIQIEATANSTTSLENVTLAAIDVLGVSEGESQLTVESVSASGADETAYEPRSIENASVSVLPPETDTSVEFRLPSNEIDAGDEVTGQVVVVGASNGINAYDLNLSVANSSVARVSDVTLTGEPNFDDSSVSDDESTAIVSAGMGDNAHGPASETTIANVTLSGVQSGTTNVTVDQSAGPSVQDRDGIEYTLDSFSGSSLSVTGEITDPTVAVSPDESTISVDESVNMSVEASDLVRGLSEISYTLSVDDSVVDSEISVPGASDVEVSEADGQITVDATRSEPVENAEATLGTLQLIGVAAGDTAVTIESIDLADDGGIQYEPREVTNGSTRVLAGGETTLEFRADDDELAAGEETTGDLVVTNVPEGVNAFSVNVTSDDPSVASFESIDLAGSPKFPDSSVSADGSVASVSAGMGDTPHPGADEIRLGTVTIAADSEGTTSFDIQSGYQVDNTDGVTYEIGSTTGDSLSVSGEISDPSVEIRPESVETDVGNSTTTSIVASDLVSGLSTVSYEVSVDDSVADISDVTVPDADSSVTDVSIADGTATVETTFEDNLSGETRVLGEIELVGTDGGSSNVTIDSIELSDSEDTAYDIRKVTNGSITVLSGAEGVSVGVELQRNEIPRSGSLTGEVVVYDADRGIGAYDMNLSIDNESVAAFETIDPTNNPSFDQSEVIESDIIELSAGMGPNVHDPGDVVIATFTVQPAAVGSVSIDIEEPRVVDTDNAQYDILATESADLTVAESLAIFEVESVSDRNLSTGTLDAVSFTGSVTNVGDQADTQDVELYIDDERVATKSVELGVNASETVTFEDVSIDKPPGEYTYRIETKSDSASGMLTITSGPPVVLGDEAPRDLDGDGTFEDVNGDGQFDIFDVQSLNANLETEPVQENSGFFKFTGGDGSADVFDVQALFQQLD